MAENVQYLNKYDFCFKNIGCCCTVVHDIHFYENHETFQCFFSLTLHSAYDVI